MNRVHVSVSGTQQQVNPAEGTLLTLCVCVYVRLHVICLYVSKCVCVCMCLCEGLSVYLSCCVLGSTLSGAIPSVFHHHLPWQRCLMTHIHSHTIVPSVPQYQSALGRCRRGRKGNDPMFLHHVSSTAPLTFSISFSHKFPLWTIWYTNKHEEILVWACSELIFWTIKPFVEC